MVHSICSLLADPWTRCCRNLKIHFLLSTLYFQREMCGVSFPGADQNMTSAFSKLTSEQSTVPNLHCVSMINFTSSRVALPEQSYMRAAVPGWLLPWPLPYLWSSKTFPDVRKCILTTASKFHAASFIMAAQARLTKTGPVVQGCFHTWVMRRGGHAGHHPLWYRPPSSGTCLRILLKFEKSLSCLVAATARDAKGLSGFFLM